MILFFLHKCDSRQGVNYLKFNVIMKVRTPGENGPPFQRGAIGKGKTPTHIKFRGKHIITSD